ncbi:hypothetical protein [Streptomyces hesseae]|uniref:Type A2 lantipeptide n=1 Tax=Streptomyces hesseae TaxID=3075519 RepID=A0ABU2SJT2_9ACTN|nr:hypothetical protein [Streptomyces sp. DSM 40473]MDT0449237.1 hypothetical protein [Streptomyces sp. DSM 40473]
MRNDIETREIADAELDGIAGGVAINGGLLGAVTGDVHNVVNTVTSLNTVGAVKAVPAGVEGIIGLNVGVAGL